MVVVQPLHRKTILRFYLLGTLTLSTGLSISGPFKKEVRGRRQSVEVEIWIVDVDLVDVDLVDAFQAYLERRIRFVLGRFSRSIRRVTVRVTATAEDCDSEVAITINLIPKCRVVIFARTLMCTGRSTAGSRQ
jgi:hypothetical protein